MTTPPVRDVTAATAATVKIRNQNGCLRSWAIAVSASEKAWLFGASVRASRQQAAASEYRPCWANIFAFRSSIDGRKELPAGNVTKIASAAS
jgi:hypothetical protein